MFKQILYLLDFLYQHTILNGHCCIVLRYFTYSISYPSFPCSFASWHNPGITINRIAEFALSYIESKSYWYYLVKYVFAARSFLQVF